MGRVHPRMLKEGQTGKWSTWKFGTFYPRG
jgi:hypothetical protein